MTPSEKRTQHFRIDGMTCGGCASRISKALQENLPEVEPQLDVAEKRLTASFDPSKIALEQILHVLDEAGYAATPL